MPDAIRLRDLSAVLLVTACSSSTSSPQQTPVGSKPPPVDAAPDAAEVAIAAPDSAEPVGPGDPPDFNMPSCPSGKWCGRQADTKGMAGAYAKDVMGCKSQLAAWDDKGNRRKIP